MDDCAQTCLQLFNQLRRADYASAEIAALRDAYDLAVDLFAGYFIKSGRTQIAHTVGTASVLTSLHAPAAVVAAGLIHNVYANGDFGDGRYGVSRARRAYVTRALGAEAEEYVYRFPALEWNSQSIPVLHESVGALSPIDRHVLLMRLAEQLDHHRNLGGFYYHDGVEKCREHIHRNGRLIVEIAAKLGYTGLAAEWERVAEGNLSAEIPVEISEHAGRRRSSRIVPRSYRKRLPIFFREKLNRRLRVMRSAFFKPGAPCV